MTPTTILAATDLSARSDRALRRALHLARDLGARLSVIHIVDDAGPADIVAQNCDAAQATLSQFMQSLPGGDSAQIIVVPGHPVTDLVAHVLTDTPDLLVMGTHRHRPLFDGWRETTAQHITRLVPCAVLLVKDRDDHSYDHIAAATDFSPAAASAMAQAAALAPEATITPVHAFHVPYSGMIARGDDGRNEVEASFRAEATAADTKWRDTDALPDRTEATVFVAASPLEALGNFVSQSGATLICAGAHGRVGQGRALLGSIAIDLMRWPPCDILIARPT